MASISTVEPNANESSHKLATESLPSSSQDLEIQEDGEVQALNLYTLPLLENANKVEKKWQAVTIALGREIQLARPLTVVELGALSAERGIGSARTLTRCIDSVKTGVSLTPKKPSGRKPEVLQQVNEFMASAAESFNYHFSHEVMAMHVQENLARGSASTVRRVLKKKNSVGKLPAND